MTKIDIRQLPPDIMEIGEQAIAHALTGSPIPEKFIALEEWLESEGWDFLVGPGCVQDYGFNLSDLSYWRFDDKELACEKEIEDFSQITNDMRVNFARELVEEAASELDDTICPSIHCVDIEFNEKSAVIGCLLEIHGQGGPAPSWQGIYRNREEFIKTIRSNGIVLLDQIYLIQDQEILTLWKKG